VYEPVALVQGSKHESYGEVYEDFFGLGLDEVQLEEVEKQTAMEKEVSGKWIGEAEEMIRSLRRVVDRSLCNVMWSVKEFWLPDANVWSAKYLIRSKYQQAKKTFQYSETVYANNVNCIHIAVQFRVGDVLPTRSNWFLEVFQKLEGALEGHCLHYYFFARNYTVWKNDFPELVDYPRSTYVNISTLFSFYHLVESEVLVMSSSEFGAWAGTISERTLPIAPNIPRNKNNPQTYPRHAVVWNLHSGFHRNHEEQFGTWRKRIVSHLGDMCK